MEVLPRGPHDGKEAIWLDELVLHTIALNMTSACDLARLARVHAALQSAASLAARKKLQHILHRLQTTLPQQTWSESSCISALARWEAVETSNLLWFKADAHTLSLVQYGQSCQRYARAWVDLSASRCHAMTAAGKVPPMYNARAINGRGALEFTGASVLHTQPFSKPLQQPITIMVVARARGDTTIVDSLGYR